MRVPTEPEFEPGALLRQINVPEDLRRLRPDQLPEVCRQLRDYIIDVVAVHGGHFGASLGAVELTVAAHYAYQTPHDLLVWDVGHQAYGHKILTGRRDAFPTNRKRGGISGFPRRDESPYDTFGVAHASTSISAALGMAVARDLSGGDQRVLAILGDGALTGGLAFEGLNNAGSSGSDLVVVLNDNRMSIDPNVGALNEYLAGITSGKAWNHFRDDVWGLLQKMRGKGGGTLQRLAAKLEEGIKATLTPGGLFEALGFRYFGPVDGHDIGLLVEMLSDLRALHGPILLHAVTVKGKGFAPAEQDQVKWHAQSSPFDKVTGLSLKGKAEPAPKRPPLWQDVFGQALVDLARRDARIVGITAAMPSGTGVKQMLDEMPGRAFDVGIAEMHASVFAAGLAAQGCRPFLAIYSSFLQRAYDGVVHDIALQNLPVVLCMDRAGIAGSDGPTHHGALDIAYLRCVPGLVLSAPMDEQDLVDLMYTASRHDAPFAIRYPRGAATGAALRPDFTELPIGRGRRIREGERLAFLSYGAIGQHVVEACARLQAHGIRAAHYDLRFCKPLDDALLEEVAGAFSHIITVEDGAALGGAGTAVLEWMSERGYTPRIRRLGIPDAFVEHGTQEELYDLIGLSPAGIAEAALAMLLPDAAAEPQGLLSDSVAST